MGTSCCLDVCQARSQGHIARPVPGQMPERRPSRPAWMMPGSRMKVTSGTKLDNSHPIELSPAASAGVVAMLKALTKSCAGRRNTSEIQQNPVTHGYTLMGCSAARGMREISIPRVYPQNYGRGDGRLAQLCSDYTVTICQLHDPRIFYESQAAPPCSANIYMWQCKRFRDEMTWIAT